MTDRERTFEYQSTMSYVKARWNIIGKKIQEAEAKWPGYFETFDNVEDYDEKKTLFVQDKKFIEMMDRTDHLESIWRQFRKIGEDIDMACALSYFKVNDPAFNTKIKKIMQSETGLLKRGENLKNHLEKHKIEYWFPECVILKPPYDQKVKQHVRFLKERGWFEKKDEIPYDGTNMPYDNVEMHMPDYEPIKNIYETREDGITEEDLGYMWKIGSDMGHESWLYPTDSYAKGKRRRDMMNKYKSGMQRVKSLYNKIGVFLQGHTFYVSSDRSGIHLYLDVDGTSMTSYMEADIKDMDNPLYVVKFGYPFWVYDCYGNSWSSVT